MIVNIYAIKDELADMWSNPFVLNEKTANRTFQFMAKQRSEEECKDQKIYLIGHYDNETGEIGALDIKTGNIISERATAVCDLEKAWKEFHNA